MPREKEDAVRKEFAGLSNTDLVRQLTWLVAEIESRLENYLEAADESDDALAHGISLATRVEHALSTEKHRIWTVREELSKLHVYEVA